MLYEVITIAVLRDEPIAIVSSSEGADREDGGRVLTFVDLESGASYNFV